MKKYLGIGLFAAAAFWGVGARSLHAQETALFEDFNGDLSAWLQDSSFETSQVLKEREPGDFALSLRTVLDKFPTFDRELSFQQGRSLFSFELNAPVGSLPQDRIDTYLRNNDIQANIDIASFATGEWEEIIFEVNASEDSSLLDASLQDFFAVFNVQSAVRPHDIPLDVLIDWSFDYAK